MNSQQKIINLLSICRKAGKIVSGFDAVKDAVFEGYVSCVIVTEDISQKTLKEVKFFCNNAKVDIVALDLSSIDMFDIAGKEVVVAGVCDFGFANRIRTLGVVTRPRTPRKKSKPDGNNSK